MGEDASQFVAVESSSMQIRRLPSSTASEKLAEHDVDPDASGVEKFFVDLWLGRLVMKLLMSVRHGSANTMCYQGELVYVFHILE